MTIFLVKGGLTEFVVVKYHVIGKMNCFILLIFSLIGPVHAQSNVAGLGRYIIDVTTPDSLNSADFEEQEQAYIKGTLTLPCTHIRSFKSSKLNVSGTLITNLNLFFYDNKLVKLTCTYSPELNEFFLAKYGKGMSRPISYVQLCVQKKNTPMVLQGEAWQNADVLAIAVHSKGYNSNCQMEEAHRLTIVNQRILPLTSDCDLQAIDRFAEEFEAILNNYQADQQKRGKITNNKR